MTLQAENSIAFAAAGTADLNLAEQVSRQKFLFYYAPGFINFHIIVKKFMSLLIF
mgnify:CR=1 FL=1